MMVRCVGLSDSLMLNPYPVDCGPSLGFDFFEALMQLLLLL